MRFSIGLSNPFPDLTKAHHVIGIDDEVVYVPTGHNGKVTNIERGTYYVTLASGHPIACSIHDLCPTDFHAADSTPVAARETAAVEMNRAIKASSPFPGETLAKSANGGFSVGQRVRDRASGRFAKITAIQSGILHVLYEDGTREASTVSKFMEAA